jgi:hypothetical protein
MGVSLAVQYQSGRPATLTMTAAIYASLKRVFRVPTILIIRAASETQRLAASEMTGRIRLFRQSVKPATVPSSGGRSPDW